jgi:hypothetical protein
MLSENVENTQNSTSCPQESPSLINPGKNYTDSRRNPIGEILTIISGNSDIVRLEYDFDPLINPLLPQTEQPATPSPQDSSILNKF